MEAKVTFSSNSVQKTQEIAKKLAKNLKAGDVIAIYGDLGAGKTVFVQGLAKGFNIQPQITSPTFVYMRQYQIKHDNKHLIFYHLDLFRVESKKDVERLGLDEIFSSKSIVVVEWADKLTNLPKSRIDVFIKKLNEKTRRVKIQRH